MRFVLVGLSLIIAWFAWWRAQEGAPEAAAAAGSAVSKQQQQQQRQRYQQQQGPSAGPGPQGLRSGLRSAGVTLLEMFSGRYLYRALVHGVAHPKQAARHIKAS
jgi:hypothetical protein